MYKWRQHPYVPRGRTRHSLWQVSCHSSRFCIWISTFKYIPNDRAVATIGAWGGGNCPPPIGISPTKLREIIKMTIFLWWFSRNFTNFKKFVEKFRGLRPRTPILFINNSLILYFKINKILIIKLYLRPSFWQISHPNWRPMGARGCRRLAKIETSA